MGAHLERDREAVGFVEQLAALSAKRRWWDAAKGRMVAETLVVGVTVDKVVRQVSVSTGIARDGLINTGHVKYR